MESKPKSCGVTSLGNTCCSEIVEGKLLFFQLNVTEITGMLWNKQTFI